MSIFLVMLFTVGLLLGNWYVKNQQNQLLESQSFYESQLDAIKSKEVRINNVNLRYSTLEDYKTDELQYFYFINQIQTLSGVAKIKTIEYGNGSEFTIAGLTKTEEDFDVMLAYLESSSEFLYVNIDSFRELEAEEKAVAKEINEEDYNFSWVISGLYEKADVTLETYTEDFNE